MSQYGHLSAINKDNHSDYYTKVVNKAFNLGINKSLTEQSFKKLNKFTDLTLEGKVMFIAGSATINVVKKFGCEKAKNRYQYY